MKNPSQAEFAHFRFVRDAGGDVVALPSQGMDERTIMVLDCERWGLSRLHIFEGAAQRKELLEAFQKEMQQVSTIRSDSISRIASWGRDGAELFYADEMQDGEGMPEYLDRTGRVVQGVCGEWMLQLFDMLDQAPSGALSFGRFTTQNFQVVIDRFSKVRPVFSEFHGWMKPGIQVQEHTREWYLAQVFCSLLGGVPIRTFHGDSLPRNFDELEPSIRDAVLAALEDGRFGAYNQLRGAMEVLAQRTADERNQVALPRMKVREWLARDLAQSYSGAPEFELPEELDLNSEIYALPAMIRGTKSYIQLLPGPESIPREGWLNQHHEVIRRAGRLKLNQLQVNLTEDRDSVTLVGEEAIEGVDLATIILENGTLSLEAAVILSDRISGALRMLEGQVGSCAVWWLPPENIFFVTGAQSRSGSVRLIERKGDAAWSQLPIKLRLHQTATTLMRGVGLPPRVRDLSRLPGRKFESIRRSAIALPVIFSLLSGERMRWRISIGSQFESDADISKPVIDLLERFRLQLVECPADLDEELFFEFRKLVDSPVAPPKEGKKQPEWNDGFDAAMDSVLFEGEVDLTAGDKQ
tara:strand:- start:1798 stop:3543 length:1746 start_codon:yes stop_codon:yes gene_type:complete